MDTMGSSAKHRLSPPPKYVKTENVYEKNTGFFKEYSKIKFLAMSFQTSSSESRINQTDF